MSFNRTPIQVHSGHAAQSTDTTSGVPRPSGSMSSSIPIISTVLSLGAAWFYFSLYWRQREKSAIAFVMTTVVGLHTLLVLSNLALHRPSNLFTRLGIPINAPVNLIRSLLMKEAGFNTMGERGGLVVPPEVPKDVEVLLTRLGVHGSRDIYVRFGQRAMQTCLYCSSVTDYTIVVLSAALLDYLRTATLLLLLTTESNGRQRLRANVLGVLTCVFLGEIYAFTSASAVPLEKEAKTAFMWHDNLFLARNTLFLVLPVLIQFLPAIYPPPPASAVLAAALGRLERSLPRAHLLKYFRQALMRHPYTRERVVEFWANNATEGATARSDPNVRTTASKLGFGFASPVGVGDKGGQESVLRANTRMVVQSLKPFFMPPPN